MFTCTLYTVRISNNAMNEIKTCFLYICPFMKCFPRISANMESHLKHEGGRNGTGKESGRDSVNARPSQLWKSTIGYASIQLGCYTLPSTGVCSLNSARLIRIYLTSRGRHFHSLQNCTNNSRAQAAMRTKGTFNGKRGCTRVRGISVGK